MNLVSRDPFFEFYISMFWCTGSMNRAIYIESARRFGVDATSSFMLVDPESPLMTLMSEDHLMSSAPPQEISKNN